MRILSRFVYEGRNCYDVDKGDYREVTSERGLYEESTIEGLIESGYKFQDYHGTIFTPEGVLIQELAESACVATQSELQQMLDMEEAVLTEAEATKYFVRAVEVKFVEKRQPVEIRFHTRDELVNYLEEVNRNKEHGVADFLPLNSFVDPDALFTLEELSGNNEVRRLFAKIDKRRVLRNREEYTALVEFLQGQGLLGEEFTTMDLNQAYLAWGVCGLKTPITEVFREVGAELNLRDSFVKSGYEEGHIDDYSGRSIEWAVMDKTGMLHTSQIKENWSSDDVGDYYKKLTALTENEKQRYFRLYRTADSWATKYQVIKCLMTKEKERLHIELYEDGIRGEAVFELGSYVIWSNGVLNYGDFINMQVLDGTSVLLDKVDTEAKYTAYNLAAAKAADMLRKLKKAVPVQSSSEMLKNESATLQEIATAIGNSLVEEGEFTDFNGKQAYDYYRKGPCSDLVREYNPEDRQCSSRDELIEVMLSTRDALIDEDKYNPRLKEEALKNADEKTYGTPLEALEFIHMLKHDGVTVGNMKAGRLADAGDENKELTELILRLIALEAGEEATLPEIQSVIRRIDFCNLIDLSDILYEKNQEYLGYLKDRAEFRANRAKFAAKLVWVTKVFREIANVPAEEQRHYMFECYEYPNLRGTMEERMFETIIAAVDKAIESNADISGQDKDISKILAPEIASVVLLRLILKNSIIERQENVIVEVDLPIGEENTTIAVWLSCKSMAPILEGRYTSQDYKKYCTLSDWCEHAIDSEGRHNFYCINADITPWYVLPKGNITIKSYPFAVNYYGRRVTLDAVSDDASFEQKLDASGACVDHIQRLWYGRDLLGGSMDDLLYDVANVGNPDDTFTGVIGESPMEYMQRWIKHNVVYKDDLNRCLRRIPLRADKLFSDDTFAGVEIAKQMVDEDGSPITEIVTECTDLGDKRMWSRNLQVLVVGKKMSLPEFNKRNKIYSFNSREVAYEDIERWIPIVNGTFKPSAQLLYGTGLLIISKPGKKPQLLNLYTATIEALDALSELNILYKLSANKYLIKTGRMYVVEVV